MAGQIVLALLGSVLLGLVLLLIGLRGKRLNAHPICALCRFDLEGTYPQSITCPECGAGLRRRKGVRIGARRKRWITLSAGVLLILLPAGLLGTVLYAVLTGADLNTYKPVGLLLWEGRRGNDATATAAAKELLTRVQNKQVSPETVKNIAAAALGFQADLDATWRTEWGDIIETAKITGAIGTEEYNCFLEQAAVLEFSIRRRVRQGDPIAVEAKLKEARIGSGSQFSVITQFTKRTIDGETARPRPTAPAGGWLAGLMGMPAPGVDDQPGYFHLSGQAAAWGGMNQGQCRGTLRPERDLAPGPHTAEVTLSLTAQVPNLTGGVWRPMQGVLPTSRAVRTATLTFVVTPPEQPTVELVDPTAEQIAAFEQALRPQNIQVQDAAGGLMGMKIKYGHIAFNPGSVPLDAVFTVKLRIGDSLGPAMGHVVFRAPDPNQPVVTGPQQMTVNHQWASLQLPASFDAKMVAVVLEPDLGAALNIVDMTEIYGQAIEFTDIEVAKAQW